MGYTIQVRGGELLDSDDVKAEVDESIRYSSVIPDIVARTIASWWHSPGTVGRVMSQLSHGIEFDTDELLRDIALTMPEAKEPAQQLELMALRAWAEHFRGDYRS